MTAEPLIQAQGLIVVESRGAGFVDVTSQVAAWLTRERLLHGVVTLFLRHTSASLVIQENASPEVLDDLAMVLDRLAPRTLPWQHALEGPDDMPAHARTMLTGPSTSIPVTDGRMRLGTWQAIYVAEHREAPHLRELALAFIGTRRDSAPR